MEDPRYLPSLRSLARVAAAYGYRLTVEFLPQDAPKTSGGSAPRPPKRSGGATPRPPRKRPA